MKKNKRSILKSSKKFIKTPAKSRQPLASEVAILGSMHASPDDIKDIFYEMTRHNIDNRINRMPEY